MKVLVAIFSLIFFLGMHAQTSNKPLVFGHRGCRGILPENTIKAFEKAIELGVDGIEWDVVVDGEGKLIISHEPYMDATYCLDTLGQAIPRSKERDYTIFEMSTVAVQAFDCGTKPHPKFPDQANYKAYKPTVQEAFKAINFEHTTILFEIKSDHSDYRKYQPEPAEYAKIIANEVANFPYRGNIIFMCFDPGMLEAMYDLLPDYRYVYLTYQPFQSIPSSLKDLSFTPYALGMFHPTIRKKGVAKAHERGIKVFAWTVNKAHSFDKTARYGVDGIITDYPNRFAVRKNELH